MKLSSVTLWLVVLIGLVVLGVACSPKVVPSSGTRPPTDAKDVMIYTKEPKKYEQLGDVEVPVGGDVKWDRNGDATAGFEKLKAAAAARGANGILLKVGGSDVESVVAGYRGKFYPVPVRRGTPSVAVVPAIYVIEP